MELGDQETIQVSTSQKTSINDILSLLTEIHGISIQREFTAPREGDIKHSCLCNEKARNLLNWNPSYTIEDGLRETYTFNKQLESDISSAYFENELMG